MEEQLFEAAMTGNTRILDQIQDPKSVAIQNPQGDTACHLALLQGRLEFALKIASLHPPILYTPNMEGDTVLHCALKIRQPGFFVQSVNLICDFLGENIKYTNKLPRKVNSLMLEAQRCYNSSRDREQRSLVCLAAEKGYFEAVKILMNTRALSSTDGPRRSTALHAAVRHGHYDIVQLLMQRKRSLIFDRDEDKHTPMFIAVELKDVKMCNLLQMKLEYSEDPMIIIIGTDGPSAIHLAAQNDDFLEIFQLLMERCPRRVHVNKNNGQNVLHIAVKEKALGVVKFIMKDKELSSWMINAHDNDGNTPLSLATASNGNEEILNALLASPLNVPPLKDDAENVQRKAIENYHSSLLVMATLITTVTFAAAFSLPGGYKNDRPNEGTATLIGSVAFRVFLVFDTLSLLTSILSTAFLIVFAGTAKFNRRFRVYFLNKFKANMDFLEVAVNSLSFSLVFMLAAFAAGVWAVIGSECKWLAILIGAVITGIILFVLVEWLWLYRRLMLEKMGKMGHCCG